MALNEYKLVYELNQRNVILIFMVILINLLIKEEELMIGVKLLKN
jgi:hypothetical protein